MFSDTCSGHPEVSCAHGGYPDPNDCSRCICPEGLGGDTCETAYVPSTDGGQLITHVYTYLWDATLKYLNCCYIFMISLSYMQSVSGVS